MVNASDCCLVPYPYHEFQLINHSRLSAETMDSRRESMPARGAKTRSFHINTGVFRSMNPEVNRQQQLYCSQSRFAGVGLNINLYV
jgi:hypothetical protein